MPKRPSLAYGDGLWEEIGRGVATTYRPCRDLVSDGGTRPASSVFLREVCRTGFGLASGWLQAADSVHRGARRVQKRPPTCRHEAAASSPAVRQRRSELPTRPTRCRSKSSVVLKWRPQTAQRQRSPVSLRCLLITLLLWLWSLCERGVIREDREEDRRGDREGRHGQSA